VKVIDSYEPITRILPAPWIMIIFLEQEGGGKGSDGERGGERERARRRDWEPKNGYGTTDVRKGKGREEEEGMK
jgi:hypothetical protein